MKGYITEKQEFLFQDTELGVMTQNLHIASAQNGKIGLQILLESSGKEACIVLEDDRFEVSYYQMISIPVEMNTGNGVDQGGAMVVLLEECPDYAIRKAPFTVYDCLRPLDNGVVGAVSGRVAAYVCIGPKQGISAGSYDLELRIEMDGEVHTCHIAYVVYPVQYNEDLFQQTNWFSLKSMETLHHVQVGTPAYYEVVRNYARAMRRTHQKTFNIWLHQDYALHSAEAPWEFDFEDLKPIIEIFFEEGFDTLETGGILTRGYCPDHSPDMYTNDFKCAAAPEISADSDQGYQLLCSEMQAFSDFLKRNNWDQRVLFHIMDEPDVHYLSEEDLQARRVQYFMTANIVRRYLPNVKIMEAVKTTTFRGAIDIMVPITDGYQNNKESFDKAIAMGDEVWTYVCCGPEGIWLNRFLDQPLMNGRLLFWGCAANRISGYLHWGFNQFGCTPDPFKETRGLNDSGIGTDYPCGDAFIVYPGENGPWLSMRLEAERRGAEEAALLCDLRQKDPIVHDALIRKIFRAFDDYESNPEVLEQVSEQLLQLLS